MVTAPAAPAGKVARLPGRRYDHRFFTTMSVVMLATVFAGFAPTYFLAGMSHAHLASPILHVHGAAFTAWVVLLVVQSVLVASHRIKIHRWLGFGTFALGAFMIVLGVLAATDSMVRHIPENRIANEEFYIVSLSEMMLFGVLLVFAYRTRRRPAEHKRLIYVATTVLMGAAIYRLPMHWVHARLHVVSLMVYVFLAILIAYDLWSTRKVNRATVWASLFVILIEETRMPLATTAAWHTFAAWAARFWG
jgi:FtsH-binding integral membrane protein